jgi:hypothetical protein
MRGGGLAKWLVKNGKGAKEAVSEAANLVKGEAKDVAKGAKSLAGRALDKNKNVSLPYLSKSEAKAVGVGGAAAGAGAGVAAGRASKDDNDADDKPKKKKRPYMDDAEC